MEMTKSQIIAEIESCKKRIEELDKMAQNMKDDELKVWEPKCCEPYIFIDNTGKIVRSQNCFRCDFDRIDFHNVFPSSSSDSCQYYAHNVLALQNLLWQLHELLCPNYFPDWRVMSEKCYCYYSHERQKWDWNWTNKTDNSVVYFTQEAAIKACEILNRDRVTK